MNRKHLTALLALSAMTAACAPNGSAPGGTPQPDPLGTERIAEVNGESIPTSVFEVYSLTAMQRSPNDLGAEERQQLTEQIIAIQLLASEAERSGVLNDTRVAAEIEYQRMQLLARAMTERFRTDNAATEAELRQLYEESLSRFSNTQYKARHILVETEDEASSLIAQLDAGADFAELAREHSTGPTGPEGGDLGWFSAESMVAPFGQAVLDSEVGTPFPEPVQTRFGWHVILVEDLREQQPPGLEAVRAELETEVNRRKLEQYLTALREAAVVVVE